jgi:hypothetical protein
LRGNIILFIDKLKNFLFFGFFLIVLCSFFMCKSENNVVKDDKDRTSDKVDQRTVFIIDEKRTNDDDLSLHMKNLFNYIEEFIATGNFNGWYNSLSQKYKNYINDQTNLKKMSVDSDILSNKGITLKSPKDYFEFVVIQSREGQILKFKDFKVVDKTHAKVIYERYEKERFEYDFIFENNSWKLDR